MPRPGAAYKVYIIDEVHMLTIGAFNALLKTLEEPPEHVKFIFATTEPQKVPATILSRCQRFDLRRIATRDMVAHLAMIAKSEKVKIDDDALLAVARGAEGGLRDAESALDQLMTFCGKDITEANVLSVFGLVSWKNLEHLVEALLKGDLAGVLRLVAELDEAGKDLQRLSMEVLEYAAEPAGGGVCRRCAGRARHWRIRSSRYLAPSRPVWCRRGAWPVWWRC
jgi:DNA polymerase-3 subunit gamma/tau